MSSNPKIRNFSTHFVKLYHFNTDRKQTSQQISCVIVPSKSNYRIYDRGNCNMGVSQHREHVTYAALRELNTSSYAYTVFGRTNLTSQTNRLTGQSQCQNFLLVILITVPRTDNNSPWDTEI